jgi:hypothetical protein
MAWKHFAEKNYENHLRSINHEVCTAAARSPPNILDALVLENIILSEDKIGWLPMWYNETESDFCHQSFIYGVSSVLFQPHVNFMRKFELEVFNFSEKITWFAIYFVLLTEFSTCQSTNLKEMTRFIL